MFKKLWQALARLVNNANNLADSFDEADVLVRDKFGLEPRDNGNNQLEHRDGDDAPRKRLTKKTEEDS